jgi:hypothetical protein
MGPPVTIDDVQGPNSRDTRGCLRFGMGCDSNGGLSDSYQRLDSRSQMQSYGHPRPHLRLHSRLFEGSDQWPRETDIETEIEC